ncbi:MAG: ABC transporter permease [Chloroflexota bacterium]|jgi:ABC-2 type transport system permease protein
MSKIWLVAKHQLRQETSKRTFVLLLLLLPLILVFAVGFGALIAKLEQDEAALGFVDRAGIIADPTLGPEDDNVTLVAYGSVEEAQAALDAETIDGYYVIAANYAMTHQAELFYLEQPPGSAMRYFEEVVRTNLVADETPALADRLLEGSNLTVRATEYDREYSVDTSIAGLFLPLVIAIFFVFLIMTTSGYMTTVLADEKVNRTIEIVVTSISPGQMMAGKLLGALGIALLQLVVWTLFLVGAVWVGGQVFDLSWLQNVDISWRDAAMIILVSLPAYFFMAALMTLLGSLVSDDMEAQQIGSLGFIIPMMPIYLLMVIIPEPNGLVALILSFFPATAILTLGVRSLLMVVPIWQVIVSMIISLVSALFLTWLAGRAFRLSMLRYGQRLRLSELFHGDGARRPAASQS